MNLNLWGFLPLQRGGGREEAEGGDRAAEEGGGGPGGQVPRGGEDQSRRGELVSFGKRRPGLNHSMDETPSRSLIRGCRPSGN